jgi:ACS family glucarate transporter-like MFS transporter
MTPPPTTRIRWLLITWLFILSSVAFLDRVNLGIAASHFEADYRLTDVQFGALSTFFLIGYALFQTPAGWLADKFSSRRVLCGAVLWWGIFTALSATIPSDWARPYLLLIAIRFLLGVGEAIMYPASNQFVARWIPTQERGMANGLIFAGVGVGSAATPPLVTYIMLHHGWRYSFWICAGVGIAAGLVWFLAARDKPEDHPWVSAQELSTIRAGLTLPDARGPAHVTAADFGGPPSSASLSAVKPGRQTSSAAPPWLRILAHRDLWLITVSYFCYGYIAWIFFAWFFTYLARERGLNLKASAFYATLPFIGIAIGSPLGGLISDRLTRKFGRRVGRCGIAVVGIALAGVFLAFGSNAASARLASVVLAGGACALYLSQSSFWSVTADISGAFSGFVSGFMNMGGQFGGALTASLTPAIAARFGWTTSFLVAASLGVLGGLLWLLVNPERSLMTPATVNENSVVAGTQAQKI